MTRYHVKIQYQFYSIKNKKYGRAFYGERTYSTKEKARKFIKTFPRRQNEEWKRYGGIVRKYKYKITEV